MTEEHTKHLSFCLASEFISVLSSHMIFRVLLSSRISETSCDELPVTPKKKLFPGSAPAFRLQGHGLGSMGLG